MITWMQKHKKWLVITIWISTIAFVGAGFVGWGSYNYSKEGGVVALVGNKKITTNEYQREYSSLYGQYSQVFGKEFNEQMADKLNLKQLAYQTLIKKNLILAYAEDLGLNITDEDIAKKLVEYKIFIKDGKFDKDMYKKVLQNNGITIKEFEHSLKNDLLLEKTKKLFTVSPTKTEIQALSQLLFLEDNINIKILNKNSIKVQANENNIKKYWDKNKKNYLSDVSYNISYTTLEVKKREHTLENLEKYYKNFKTDFRKENDKIKSFEEAKADIQKALDIQDSKRFALKEFVKYKKGEKKLTKKLIVYENKLPYGKNNNLVINSKVGVFKKPFLQGNEYVILKIDKKTSPKELSFQKAKTKVTKDYISDETTNQLKALAKKELVDFKGNNIGWINRNSISNINGLNEMEASQFLKSLFNSKTVKGDIFLGDKIVLYKINNSRLGQSNKKRDENVERLVSRLENNDLMDNLIKILENKYEIKASLDTKE